MFDEVICEMTAEVIVHYTYMYLKCIFSSNKIVLKISFSLCFWAPDLLFDRF